MKVEQLYTKCLAQGAYYVESNGEAIVIDPLREVDQYIELAKQNNATIKYIFETHFHADFVSGHLTLSERTGAPIVFGPSAKPSFEAIEATDGQVFNFGDLSIVVMHTPGHTLESTTYLLKDEKGENHAVFTGDTMFLDDVGRPDLAQKGAELTDKDLAGILFDSLRTKIMPLADHVMVYPGHGAGSACGKNMSDETVGTIGEQKKTNYALRADMTKEEFVEELTQGIPAPPAYFPLNVQMNKNGYADVNDLVKQNAKALSAAEFKAKIDANTIVLDVRHQSKFVTKHIKDSIFIGIDGGFAPWVGTILKDVKVPILLVSEPDRVEEVITRLSRVGFDHVIGYLEGSLDSWEKAGYETAAIESIPAKEFEQLYADSISVLDVRKPTEYEISHVQGAVLKPLAELENNYQTIDKEVTQYIHCAGGYRSVIASSLLKRKGIHNLSNIEGGFNQLVDLNIPIALESFA